MSNPILSIKWLLGNDRHGRRVTMTRNGDDFMIEIEPSSQRDDGERIYTLSKSLLLEAARILQETKFDA